MAWVRDFVYLVAVAAWTGAGLHFTFVATPAVFARFERTVAGDVVGALFPGYYRLAVASALLMAVAAAARWAAGRPAAAAALALALVVLAVNGVGALVLQPRIHELRLELREAAATMPQVQLQAMQQSFGRLHGLSMGLNLLAWLAGLGIWAIAAARGL